MTYSKQEQKKIDPEKEEVVVRFKQELDKHTDDIKAEIRPENTLLPINVLVEKKKQELIDIVEKVHDGCAKFGEAMASFNQYKNQYLTPEEIEHFDQDLLKFSEAHPNRDLANLQMNENTSVQQVLGITDFSLYCIYTVGYNLLKHKKYNEAANIFFFLCTLNPFVKDHWLALGIAEQESQNYQIALRSFAMAFSDNHDPYPHLASARCYLALNDMVNAESELANAMECVKLSTEPDKWTNKINNVRAEINQKK